MRKTSKTARKTAKRRAGTTRGTRKSSSKGTKKSGLLHVSRKSKRVVGSDYADRNPSDVITQPIRGNRHPQLPD